MKSSALPLVLLLTLATSSLSAPIPPPVERCSRYASCRPSLRTISSRPSSTQRSKESPPFQEPHFPTRQLELSKHADTVEIRLLEHHPTTLEITIQPDSPIKNPKLDAILDATHKDRASTNSKLQEHKPPSTKDTNAIPGISKSQSPSSKDPGVTEHGFTTSIQKKVQRVATTRGHRCTTAAAADKHGDKRMTITYTYGYRYMRTDYTSLLVVSIVVIFLLVVVLVELLDKVLETSRSLFGLDQGAIRLEDGDCERPDFLPLCTPAPFKLMPAPPPRSARTASQLMQAEALEEKSPGAE